MTILIGILAGLAAAVAVVIGVAALPSTRRLLLDWYLREVNRVAIEENPSEMIVTYPLA